MKAAQTIRPSFWRRSHHLDKMSLRELVVAYFQYPAIIAYLLLSAVSLGLYVWSPAPPLNTAAAIVVAAVLYPLVWYVLHRWVLHGLWMFKLPVMA